MAISRESTMVRSDSMTPPAPSAPTGAPLVVPIRALALVAPVAGLSFIVWLVSALNTGGALWVGAPVLLVTLWFAGLIGIVAVVAWKLAGRPLALPDADPNWAVDVYVIVRNEPLPLIAASLHAATRLRYPHQTWVLDAADSPTIAALSRSYNVGYITVTRSEPDDAPLTTEFVMTEALRQTAGEAVLLLRAGEVIRRDALDRSLSAFMDARTGYVQLGRDYHVMADDAPAATTALSDLMQLARNLAFAPRFEGEAVLIRREAFLHMGTELARQQQRQRAVRTLRGVEALLSRCGVDGSDAGVDVTGPHGARLRAAAGLAAIRLQRDDDTSDMFAPLLSAFAAASEDLRGIDLAALRLELDLPPEADLATILTGPGARFFRLGYVRLSTLAAIGAARLLVQALVETREQTVADFGSISAGVPALASEPTRVLAASGWRGQFVPEPLVRELVPSSAEPVVATLRQHAERMRPSHQGLSARARIALAAERYTGLASAVVALTCVMTVVALATGASPVRASVADIVVHAIPFVTASVALLTALNWHLGLNGFWHEVRMAIAHSMAALTHRSASVLWSPVPCPVSPPRPQRLLLVTLLTSVIVAGTRSITDPALAGSQTLLFAGLAFFFAWVLAAGLAPGVRLRAGARPASHPVVRAATTAAER